MKTVRLPVWKPADTLPENSPMIIDDKVSLR